MKKLNKFLVSFFVGLCSLSFGVSEKDFKEGNIVILDKRVVIEGEKGLRIFPTDSVFWIKKVSKNNVSYMQNIRHTRQVVEAFVYELELTKSMSTEETDLILTCDSEPTTASLRFLSREASVKCHYPFTVYNKSTMVKN